MTDRPRHSFFGLLFWTALSFAPGLTGYLYPPDGWWNRIDKPSWTPPDYLFGIVWPILYVLIGIAVYNVARRRDHIGRGPALLWFFAQWVLNALWTPLFFGMHRPDLALACIVLMWLGIVGTIRSFARVAPLSSALLIPYLAWVSFAAALNAAVWHLNR